MPSATSTQAALAAELRRAGYYPQFVLDTVELSLAGEEIRAFLVLPETTFDTNEVRRHLSVLVATETRLLATHVDDSSAGPGNSESSATATTESVPLGQVRSVSLTQVVSAPEAYRAGQPSAEVGIAIAWGAVSRVDLDPVQCPDPECEADHGLTGEIAHDDIVVRVSADAEGVGAVQAALGFAKALSGLTARRQV